MTNDSESCEKRDLDFNTAAGSQAFGDSVVSKRHRELTGASLRISGSSSAWCSAHNVSAAAGRMFEDPEFLRFASVKLPWSLEQQSSGPVYTSQMIECLCRVYSHQRLKLL
ncbi:MAG: hypothetical protein IPL83_00025 [Bdellovibrionales bacterium]|nr:hypothetical protein [Bdellovibrionales bacterium]